MESNNKVDLEDKFNKACDYLPNLVNKLDKTLLLKFYGFYKQATIGVCNIDKPSWYSVEAKSKYYAWYNLGNMTKEDAMTNYIETLLNIDPKWNDNDSIEDDINWDGDGDNANDQNIESSTKGWVKVSSFVNNEIQINENDKCIYEFIKDGNLNQLKSKLNETNNINVNNLDENGLNCLHWACDRGHLNIVKYLIEKCNGDVNSKDEDGESCLDYAKVIENTELIDYLISKGAK